MTQSKRLLIVQYSGDFRAAWHLREAGGGETYYGHGYILDQLARLAANHGEAGFLCCLAPVHHERLPNGATVLGAGARPGLKPWAVLRQIRAFAPTHLVIHGPMPRFIRWGIGRKIPTACVFADSFATGRLYRWLRFGGLARLLNRPGVSLVANHGINAARGLVALGVRADKVLAWDFPHTRTPDAFPAKAGPSGGPFPLLPFTLLYVGSIERKKGLGDVLAALARPGMEAVRLRVAGAGQRARFEVLAEKLGVAARVEFLGLVPNAQVPAMMHAADAIVVPSRHAFPEGLPLTLYEALASRSPVIASDHPMFAGHLADGESALVFPAGDAEALASAIARLAADPALYAHLSQGGARAWQHMQEPLKWGDMLDRWLRDTPEDRGWLAQQTLAARDAGPAIAPPRDTPAQDHP